MAYFFSRNRFRLTMLKLSTIPLLMSGVFSSSLISSASSSSMYSFLM